MNGTMRLSALSGCFGYAMFFAALPAAGEVIETKPPLITVNGEAEVRVPPDEVIITLGVETSDKELTEAKADNDERVKRIIGLLEGFGIKPEHIKTDYINIEPRYKDNYEQRTFLGYWVRKTIVVTLRDLSRFEDLLSRTLESGANYVHGIDFRTTELRKHRDRARSMAIRAAREKAEALAEQLEQQIGRPYDIREMHSGWWPGYGAHWWGSRWGGAMSQNVMQSYGGAAPSEGTTLAPGQITITAAVTVSFELR
jgi:uncharacterized protein YggE